MAKNNNLKDFVTGIADAIREKKGTTELINPQDFENEIRTIQTGSDPAGGKSLAAQIIDKSVTDVTAGDLEGATKIGDYAFNGCKGLTSVTIPDSVTSIGNEAFCNCAGLTSITIPDSVTSIGDRAFYYCTGLTSISIPSSVSSIGEYAFYYCDGLTSVTIGSGVTIIRNYAFSYCRRLTSITIPDSVKTIQSWAFYYCDRLTSVKFMGQPPTIQSNTFYRCNSVAKYDFRGATSVPTLSSTQSLGHASGCQIVVPDSLYDSWQQATNWVALTDVVWVKASEYTEE